MSRRTTTVTVGTLIAASLLLACTACGGSDESGAHATPTAAAKSAVPHRGASATATPGPAAKLAALDGDLRPADQYQQVLTALAPRCKEDLAGLAAVVDTTLKSLKKKGITDEDEFGVLQKLEASVPSGKPKTDCASEAAAYAARRDGN
ncbi:hypothetical protein [Streptomyces sp. MBT33]|uniref:hypothetical protein n=1 Tax=Streptomyces sp. MBT33 TaxID=1488363 RepID=UPI0019096357|nr:hypothetical protein [Streptomyces sp. MBT33]MBK3646998.1 hypothetical protein [Streptomyces sp. MBT33]